MDLQGGAVASVLFVQLLVDGVCFSVYIRDEPVYRLSANRSVHQALAEHRSAA